VDRDVDLAQLAILTARDKKYVKAFSQCTSAVSDQERIADVRLALAMVVSFTLTAGNASIWL
jgi:hypothetical protein